MYHTPFTVRSIASQTERLMTRSGLNSATDWLCRCGIEFSHSATMTLPTILIGESLLLPGTPTITPQPGAATEANVTPRAVNDWASASCKLAATLSPTSSTRKGDLGASGDVVSGLTTVSEAAGLGREVEMLPRVRCWRNAGAGGRFAVSATVETSTKPAAQDTPRPARDGRRKLRVRMGCSTKWKSSTAKGITSAMRSMKSGHRPSPVRCGVTAKKMGQWIRYTP